MYLVLWNIFPVLFLSASFSCNSSQIFQNFDARSTITWHFLLNNSPEWSLIFPFVPFLAPFENIFCPQTRMQQKILTIVHNDHFTSVHLSAIFSLCFILLCNGWLERPVGISKRFTLLYAIQENVFEALTNNGTLSLCLFTKWQKNTILSS